MINSPSSAPTKEVPAILVTGAGARESLGGSAVVEALRRDASAVVIAVGRSTKERFMELPDQRLTPQEADRLKWVRADLLDTEVYAALPEEIGRILEQSQSGLQGIFLSFGTGYLEASLEGENGQQLKRQMQIANQQGPEALMSGLINNRLVSPQTHVLYAGAAFMHETLRPLAEDNVRSFIETKEGGIEALRNILGDQLLMTLILPNIRGAMLEDNIGEIGAEMAWYAGPPSDQYVQGGIGSAAAQLLLHGIPASELKRSDPALADARHVRAVVPGLGRMILGGGTQALKDSLPVQIKKHARYVMKLFSISEERYRTIWEHAKTTRVYGQDFPYDEIAYEKLRAPDAVIPRLERFLGENVLGLSQGARTVVDALPIPTTPLFEAR